MDDLLIDIEEAEKRVASIEKEIDVMREEYLKRCGWVAKNKYGFACLNAYVKGNVVCIGPHEAMRCEKEGPGCKEAK